MVEKFKGHYGEVTVGGTRAIKKSPWLTPRQALKIKYTHMIAQEALRGTKINDREVRVIQFKIARSKDGSVALVSKKVPFDKRSLQLFRHLNDSNEQGLHKRGCDICSQHEKRVNRFSIKQLKFELVRLGLTPDFHYWDVDAHNLGFTHQGEPVLIEVFNDRVGELNFENQEEFDRLVGAEKGRKLREIIEEYKRERAKLENEKS